MPSKPCNGRFTGCLSAILGIGLVLAWHASVTATEPQRELHILTPPDWDIDESRWQRLSEEYEVEKRQFFELLLELDRNRVHPLLDGPSGLLEKQRANLRRLDEFRKAALAANANANVQLNYISIRNDVAPRPSGRIVHIGLGREHKTLTEAFAELRDGDTVQFDDGEYEFVDLRLQSRPSPRGAVPSDLTFNGKGVKATLLKFGRSASVTGADRWRIADMSIDCDNDPFIDLGSGGTLELQRCRIFNYNSGAGGSNAIFGSGTVMLVENCTFDGVPGRASGRAGAVAFDLRGENLLYVRNSDFLGNLEVVRATFPCVFDGCTANNQGASLITPYSGGVTLLRRNAVPLHSRRWVQEFRYAIDDAAFVESVLNERELDDDRAQKLARAMRLDRNPAYWIGMLRHPIAAIRHQAAERVEMLLDQKVELPEPVFRDPQQIIAAVEAVDSNDPAIRRSAAVELATSALEEIVRTGDAERREAALAELARLAPPLPLAIDLECGRLMNWYEEHRHRLVWDESQGRYSLAQ